MQNRVIHISTGMQSFCFIRRNDSSRIYNFITNPSYIRLLRAIKTIGWEQKHYDYYQGCFKPKETN